MARLAASWACYQTWTITSPRPRTDARAVASGPGHGLVHAQPRGPGYGLPDAWSPVANSVVAGLLLLFRQQVSTRVVRPLMRTRPIRQGLLACRLGWAGLGSRQADISDAHYQRPGLGGFLIVWWILPAIRAGSTT